MVSLNQTHFCLVLFCIESECGKSISVPPEVIRAIFYIQIKGWRKNLPYYAWVVSIYIKML